MDDSFISGFSKYTKEERIDALVQRAGLEKELGHWLRRFESTDTEIQKIIEELSENTLTSFHLPFSIAPNFVINGKSLFIPLVSEESSVVAALSNAAGFWARRGGFHARVIGTEKKGQVHFTWNGHPSQMQLLFPEIKERLLSESLPLTAKMSSRGGGITSLEIKVMHHVMPHYYQLDASFETCDAMGANFINTCLEQFARTLQEYFSTCDKVNEKEKEIKIIMAILSNYTPRSLVQAWVECPVATLLEGKSKEENAGFAEAFMQAIRISQADVSRAVTHNKGIFNGIDALAIATGNDFRALEACAHAYASRKGHYSGLSDVSLSNDTFRFSIELPMATGVVGGVTALHPLARLSMRILDNPSAPELMMVMASAGLASNFAAVRALVSVGIQQGHMRMHLSNILNQLKVPQEMRKDIQHHFSDKPFSFSAVEEYVKKHSHE
ncbi:MAG TPA: hydroxymethylglutaryl-CoA reductase, degradative [Prolixibacteraceae bacterium]|nr:hydroxymethylglutaryl-CoA reductase, degradative [Prolixibacteraceae bacterium]